ncbi:MAG TPA: serine/threonine-protein kinase [Steroidobacteraceae bacterium]|jgi:serine/threonine-protein kinase
MQMQRWERLGELLSQLTTLPAQQRESFLRTACADDPELLAEVESLWNAHSAGGPLDAAPVFRVSDSETPEPRDLPGTEIGPYRLLRHIGEGGMGSVWLAERIDGVVKRMIALKRPHVSWIGMLAERTIQEREILAGLEHPNIARLYDAGATESGEPYLALEFIDGLAVTKYCDLHRSSVRERLALILQILEAVRYAHSRLVIHSDIKPSNILVDAAGRVHLLDFGIAKLLNSDRSDTDAAVATPFTPDYASPEQMRGQAIGTATDVYSLGVVSYELLTGRRPARATVLDASVSGTKDAGASHIRASESAADKSLRRQLKGDLDAILEQALQPDPATRYATVDAFGTDIERYLASEPVAARPDRFAYRAAKFVSRYRWQSASICIAAVALISGGALALWQAHAARAEAARAEQVKSFALSILESADTDSGAGAETTAVQLLETARLRVEKELAGQPAMAGELMSAIGYGLLGQDRTDDAVKVLKKAIDLSTQANGPEDVRTVEAQVMYGEALCEQGKSAEAIRLLAPAADRAHRIHDAHAETDALRWLSYAQIYGGDFKGGVVSARAAVAALPNPLPPGRRALQDAIQAHLGLANAFTSAEVGGVVDETRSALALMATSDEWRGTAHWWAARSFLGLGLVAEGQAAAGLQELQLAYTGAKVLLGPNHEGTEANANYWGNGALDAGDISGAINAFQTAFDAVMQRDSGRESTVLAFEHQGLAAAFAAAGQLDLADEHYAAAVRLFAADGGASAPRARRARLGRVRVLARQGRLDEADVELDALAKLTLPAAEKALLDTSKSLVRSRQGRQDEAVVLARSASAGIAALSKKSSQAQAWSIIGGVLLAAGRPQDAIALLERSDALFREVEIKTSPDHLANDQALAAARSALNPATR